MRVELEPLNRGVYRVLVAGWGHVGNLKRIGSTWKFKAVGYDGERVIPGGGPFTDRHDATVAAPDTSMLARALGIPDP